MTEQNNKNNLTRRQFLTRTAKAGICVGSASLISYWLYDSTGPQLRTEPQQLATLPGFSVLRQPGRSMSIVKGRDRTKTVNKAIDLLGGIERFIKPGETVLIKPNVAFASPAMLGATTHPDLIAAVARLCYDRGRAKQVLVTDNPINDPASCFTLTGIAGAANAAGAKIIMPKSILFKPATLAGAKLLKNWPVLFGPFKNVDKLIGIAVVKDHHRSGASMAMKNWYGLLGGRRSIFHQDINTIIAELAMMVKPTLVILDGTEVMTTNGPTGGSLSDLKRADTMIVSCDQVAADSFGCLLLGLMPSDLPYLAKADKAGTGTTDYESLKPVFATVTG